MVLPSFVEGNESLSVLSLTCKLPIADSNSEFVLFSFFPSPLTRFLASAFLLPCWHCPPFHTPKRELEPATAITHSLTFLLCPSSLLIGNKRVKILMKSRGAAAPSVVLRVDREAFPPHWSGLCCSLVRFFNASLNIT